MIKGILKSVGAIIGRYLPVTWISFRYFLRFKNLPNLSTPLTLNEKILFLSLKTDTSLWTLCADKYKVREYVVAKGCGDILVDLFGVYKVANEIALESLPNEFVIKTNHGCGGVVIVKDKKQLNVANITDSLNKNLSKTYGYLESGIHYTRIEPRIIIEQLLHEPLESTSLIDYKVWCFNGTPQYVFVISNRNGHTMDIMLYDLDWNPLPEYCVFSDTYRRAKLIDRPIAFDYMIEVARRLSEDFPQVRVDLYNISGKVYFGELTFTSLGGLMDYFSDEFQKKAGSLIDLNYRAAKDMKTLK